MFPQIFSKEELVFDVLCGKPVLIFGSKNNYLCLYAPTVTSIYVLHTLPSCVWAVFNTVSSEFSANWIMYRVCATLLLIGFLLGFLDSGPDEIPCACSATGKVIRCTRYGDNTDLWSVYCRNQVFFFDNFFLQVSKYLRYLFILVIFRPPPCTGEPTCRRISPWSPTWRWSFPAAITSKMSVRRSWFKTGKSTT